MKLSQGHYFYIIISISRWNFHYRPRNPFHDETRRIGHDFWYSQRPKGQIL